MNKFYKYLCGRKFVLVTDHKPLLAIFGSKTSLQPYAAARLHRWSVFLSQFEYAIEYRSTNDHGNADALSRLPLADPAMEDEEAKEVNLIACENIDKIPVTHKQIKQSTARDKELSKVLLYVQSGWPRQLSSEETYLQHFFRKRDELSTSQGVLLWGIRVIIPSGLRKQLLSSLHESHQGIGKMEALARQFVWWPDMDNEIECLAKSCTECCSSRPDPPTAPLHPWQFPEGAWQRLHIDLAGPLFNRMYLVVMDAHSKWPEVFDMSSNTTSQKVIEKLRDCFVRFGLPEQIVSDNGRQFVSREFKQFCHSNGIRHTTSSPYHPRTNGEAERFVNTFKQSMMQSIDELTFRLQRFLFSYRCTPHSTTIIAPAELLIGVVHALSLTS
ncbi:unnamed protein product [Orchesella dallaii]|uniref:RNA-directed DNA polymerase n=1 Tax=Orchesella dallaii TaxID=48710 RepID=A0ABP1RWZ1_9HEXA